MDSNNCIWFAAFSVLLIVMWVLHLLIIHHIKVKPLGSQTLFDIQLKDTLIAGIANGSWICFINVITRFQFFQMLLKAYWIGGPLS